MTGSFARSESLLTENLTTEFEYPPPLNPQLSVKRDRFIEGNMCGLSLRWYTIMAVVSGIKILLFDMVFCLQKNSFVITMMS